MTHQTARPHTKQRIGKGRSKMKAGQTMNMSNFLSDCKTTNTHWWLCRTLEFIIGRTTYVVVVLYCYSDRKSPWSAQAYSERRDAWKCVPNFPWVHEKNEEAAEPP